MDLIDFLIYINALNILLSRNLITQFHGNHFRNYTNKWQFLIISNFPWIFYFQRNAFSTIVEPNFKVKFGKIIDTNLVKWYLKYSNPGS